MQAVKTAEKSEDKENRKSKLSFAKPRLKNEKVFGGKISSQDTYDIKLLFLHELANLFTIKLNIHSRSFYSKINRVMKNSFVLGGLSYGRNGIGGFEKIFENYRTIAKSGRGLFEIAPYFSSMSRLIRDINEEAISLLGDKEAGKILKDAFVEAKKKYPEIPDLKGYIPSEAMGGVAAAAAAAAAFGGRIVDKMIDFIINEYIGSASTQKKMTDVQQDKILKNNESLSGITAKIFENKKLPFENRNYVYIYLFLEDYIIGRTQTADNQRYTKESLRAAIKKEFNTQLFPPMLRIIFNAEMPERFIFSEMLLKDAAGEMGDFNDFRAVLKDLDIEIEDAKPNFDAFELNFLRSNEREKIVSGIHKALLSLSGIAALILGEDKTKILLGEIFNKTAGKYRNFAVFNEAMRELPPGIFVEERRAILNPQAAAAARAVLAAMNCLKGENSKPIFERIELANTFPIEQQANAFFDVYNEIESFVEENKQAVDGKELTVEALRELVKKEANIADLDPKFQFVFFSREEQLIRLAEEFTDKFIADSGLGKEIDVLEAKKNICQRIPFLSNLIGEKGGFIPINILKKFQNMTQEDKSKHLKSSFSEYIRHFYQKSIEISGGAAARAALKKAYSLLQEKYSVLSAAIYPLLPEELLSEEEKYRILDDSYKDFASALINNLPEKFKKELLASLRDAEENISGNNDETLLQSSFSKFFELAYSRAKAEMGQEETERIFNIAYKRVEKAYAAYPIFMRILNAVPRGILEIERFNILSKEDLEKVGRALKRTEVMKSEFTNIAAHELKTPIVPLKGFLSMMLDNPDKYGLNKKAQELLGYCLGSTERLEDLVGDILDISKLEAGEMKLQAIELNLAELLKTEIKKLSFLALEKKIAIKSKIPDSLKVNGDPNRLSQAVSNLIKNAVKFTDKGSVTVNAKLIGNNVQVDFIDTGIGLRKEDIPKLFTKFFQGQDIITRKTKGTGLGLAICKEIIEKHNGRIWAESRGLGKGSVFSFNLPVKINAKGGN